VKYQRGFAIPWHIIGIVVVIGAPQVVTLRETQKVTNAAYDQAYQMVVARNNKLRNKWGKEHEKRLADNATLWDANERLRSAMANDISEGQATSLPEGTESVNCPDSTGGFAGDFKQYRGRTNAAIQRFKYEVAEGIIRSGNRVRQELARPRDLCVLRTQTLKGWAEEKLIIEYQDPDPEE
jgi:hypothetical protein